MNGNNKDFWQTVNDKINAIAKRSGIPAETIAETVVDIFMASTNKKKDGEAA